MNEKTFYWKYRWLVGSRGGFKWAQEELETEPQLDDYHSFCMFRQSVVILVYVPPKYNNIQRFCGRRFIPRFDANVPQCGLSFVGLIGSTIRVCKLENFFYAARSRTVLRM